AVGSSDADHLGQLAELVSRVRWFAHVSATPRTLGQWTQLLREALDRMVATEADTAWMLQDVLAELASLDEQTGDSAVLLGRAELSSLLGHLLPERAGRPNYGNGSLLVTSLGDLADVGFRVVCLLGADQPDEGPVLGDRLDPPGDCAEAHRHDRWLRAASAASDHVLVVYQGTNERTGEALPPPVAVQRLHDHARSAGWAVSPPRHHTLHAHAAANFDPDAPVSFDQGLARARAVPAPDPVPPGPAPAPPAPGQIELAELVRFIAHPASYYLRRTLGLAEVSAPAWPADLPIQPGGLDRWAIGDRMLAQARRGESLETLMQAEWRRGTVGPGELGRSVLESVASQVSAILEVAETFDGPGGEHEIDVEAGGVRVVGRVRTTAGMLTQVTFSKTDDRAWVETWWRLVAASAAGLGPRGGVVVGSPDYSRDIPARVTSRVIAPPPAADALTLLARLVETYVAGLTGPVPLPRRAARDLALSLRVRRHPPEPHRVLQIVERGWRYGTDADWLRFYPNPAALLSVPGTGGECRLIELSRLLYLPMIEATQVVPHV
ncbi:MAG: exodeoxyribonuclease V subunit gamma, partial [Propionibacteriaceae bacterium]|nr:exodeoxyribonuclease V subunit gamma [Propionibacteriaceae bacterium]